MTTRERKEPPKFQPDKDSNLKEFPQTDWKSILEILQAYQKVGYDDTNKECLAPFHPDKSYF
jgi:hypothetical protein